MISLVLSVLHGVFAAGLSPCFVFHPRKGKIVRGYARARSLPEDQQEVNASPWLAGHRSRCLVIIAAFPPLSLRIIVHWSPPSQWLPVLISSSPPDRELPA